MSDRIDRAGAAGGSAHVLAAEPSEPVPAPAADVDDSLVGGEVAIRTARPLSGGYAAIRASATGEVPPAAATAANRDLRFVDLNREITAGYSRFAEAFQAIVDPQAGRDGSSSVRPNWFAFAPYASREVGRGLLAAEHALAAGQLAEGAGEALGQTLARAGLSSGAVDVLVGALEARFPDGARTAIAAASFYAKWLVENAAMVPMTEGALEQLLDPRYLLVTVSRLVDLIESAPGQDLGDKLGAVARTLRNALEDGNRRIYADIGASAESYLTWRGAQLGAPSPDRVVDDFRLPGAEGPPRAREAYEWALEAAALPPGRAREGIGERFPSPPYDSRDLVVAGFALYERAGQTEDPAEADALIGVANEMVAWREQHDSVQPAFRPPVRLPGEVDRGELFRLLTPSVRLPMRDQAWGFAGYASDHLPRRDLNPLTPRSTEYDWSAFEDRWPGILAAFEQGYQDPRAIWPMPPADPNRPA